jgi:hypothetical protein
MCRLGYSDRGPSDIADRRDANLIPGPERRVPGSSSGPSASAHLRASDKERETVIGELRRHAGAGRLSVEELDQRVEAALAARERGQLDQLLADLPGTAARARPPAPGRRAHLRVYLAVNLMLIAIWALSGAGPFWPAWPLLGWGLGLVLHRGGRPWSAHHRLAGGSGDRFSPGPVLDAGANGLETGARVRPGA